MTPRLWLIFLAFLQQQKKKLVCKNKSGFVTNTRLNPGIEKNPYAHVGAHLDMGHWDERSHPRDQCFRGFLWGHIFLKICCNFRLICVCMD